MRRVRRDVTMVGLIYRWCGAEAAGFSRLGRGSYEAQQVVYAVVIRSSMTGLVPAFAPRRWTPDWATPSRGFGKNAETLRW